MDSSPLYMDRELTLSGNDFVMYLAIMGTELGKRFQSSFANCEPVASLAEPLQLNLTNVPRLQVLARAAVRDCMHESHPNKTWMFWLTNLMTQCYPTSLRTNIWKWKTFRSDTLSKRWEIVDWNSARSCKTEQKWDMAYPYPRSKAKTKPSMAVWFLCITFEILRITIKVYEDLPSSMRILSEFGPLLRQVKLTKRWPCQLQLAT